MQSNRAQAIQYNATRDNGTLNISMFLASQNNEFRFMRFFGIKAKFRCLFKSTQSEWKVKKSTGK
jgi:hypothetical protein